MSRALLFRGLLLGALVVSAAACEKNEKSTTTTNAAAQPTTAPKPAETAAAANGTANTATGKVEKVAITFKDVGLSTPESVLYDADADEYVVSNVDGEPLAADGKGFLSRLKPDGTVAALKWVESGKNKVTLNAPKGLGLLGDDLYVADLDTVRIFDKKTGAPKGEVKIPGATFLNDVAVTSDGRVLVSDTGMKAGAKGFEPTGTDAIWAIDKNKKLTAVAKGKDLGNPNGIAAIGDKIAVVTFGTGELYFLDAKGKKENAQKLPKGQLDGIVPIGDELLISSWESATVYRGKAGGEFKPVVEGVKAPADIGYDTKRARLLVPLFQDNQVQLYDLH